MDPAKLTTNDEIFIFDLITTDPEPPKKKLKIEIDSKDTDDYNKNTISDKVNFPFEKKCIFCSEKCKQNQRTTRMVTTLGFKDRIISICDSRNDEWSKSILNIINQVPCLVQSEARYHEKCFNKFTSSWSFKSSPVGRPSSINLRKSFETLCNYLEQSPECPYLLSGLEKIIKQNDYLPPKETILKMLKEKYGEKISIFRRPGRQPIICFSDVVANKISEIIPSEKKPAIVNEEKNILENAAAILRRDIQADNFYQIYCDINASNYNSTSNNKIPKSLNNFLNKLLLPPEKKYSKKIEPEKIVVAHSIINIIQSMRASER